MRLKIMTIAIVVAGVVVVLLVQTATPASAAEASHVWAAAPDSLKTVITRITNWLVGLLVALSTLLLTIGGLRYLMAGGDPGEVNKAKETLKYAALGFGVAALAPLLVDILKGFVA